MRERECQWSVGDSLQSAYFLTDVTLRSATCRPGRSHPARHSSTKLRAVGITIPWHRGCIRDPRVSQPRSFQCARSKAQRSDLKRSSTCPFPHGLPLNGQQQASARLAAQLELERGPCCSFARVSSSACPFTSWVPLFFDEDPMQLQQLLHAHERTWITPGCWQRALSWMDASGWSSLPSSAHTTSLRHDCSSESIHAASQLPPGPRGLPRGSAIMHV